MKIIEEIKKKSLKESSKLLLSNSAMRQMLLPHMDKKIRALFKDAMEKPYELPAEVEAQYWFIKNLLMRASERMDEKLLSVNLVKSVFSSFVDNVLFTGVPAKNKAYDEEGIENPTLLVISPTHQCNLQCKGCYAGSNKKTASSLDWETFDRILTEKENLWDSYFTTISGGEPFMWKDGDSTIYDMFSRHKNQYFMVYTNGTLLNKKNAERLAEIGNVAPAISVEGFKEETDDRRGDGVYEKILEAFENLRNAGVPFGISVTPTRHNAELLFSDEFVDFYFEEQKAIFGWAFQYMPVGRDIDFDIMITPEQRVEMYKRSREILEERGYSYIDFWNNGYLSSGCIAGGRKGGFFHINWDGNVAPCVFIPYYTANIYDIYKNGGDLNTARNCKFFRDIRKWQRDYGYMRHRDNVENRLMPCPIRDHHADIMKIFKKNKVMPLDSYAEKALESDFYHENLIEYDKQLASALDPVWEEDFLNYKDNWNNDTK